MNDVLSAIQSTVADTVTEEATDAR